MIHQSNRDIWKLFQLKLKINFLLPCVLNFTEINQNTSKCSSLKLVGQIIWSMDEVYQDMSYMTHFSKMSAAYGMPCTVCCIPCDLWIKYLSQKLKVDISVKVSFHSCQLKTAQNKVDLMTMLTMIVHAISIMTNGMFLHMVSKWCARLFRYVTCVESILKSNNVLIVQSLQVILESVCWTTYARTINLI